MALIDIPQYRSELAEIRKSLLAAGDALHIDHIREQLDELTEEMNQPEFWNDPDHSAKVNQKVSNLKGKLEHYEKLLSSADDIEVMLEMAEEEKDEDTVTEAVDELATLKEHTDALELETLMRGDYDDNDAVLSLHAGAGGTEAQDWTSMLFRMYTRYCEKMGFTVKVLDLLDGDEAGIKSVTFEVSGDHAYGYLRGEKGVHRLVRISPFDANARRHTSFASLDVAPMLDLLDGDEAGIKSVTFEVSGDHAYGYLRGEKGVHRLVRISPFDANARRHTSFASLDVAPMLEDDDSDIEINMKDVRVDTYHSSGAGGQNVNKTSSAVRMTHYPTGIVVSCQTERDQVQNRATCIKMLKAKLLELRERAKEEEMANIKGEMKKIEWGSQIRSYVFQPYTMVKDHRTNYESGNIDDVMDGNLEGFITAYLKMQ